MYPRPSAPPLIDLDSNDGAANCNYNCEDGCDVEFLVGKNDEDMMRIPVHSHKLSEYPVFKAMLSEDYNVKYSICDGGHRKLKQIRVDQIDSKAFDNMMKFIYKEPVNFQSVDLTIEILKAAQEFLLPGLVRACVKNLDKMISLGNVLIIFVNVQYLCNDVENLEELVQSTIHMPFPKRKKYSIFSSHQNQATTTFANAKCTAATNPPQDKHLSAGLEMKNLCVWLFCQCLAFIDVHAVDVLKLDGMEELDRSYVELLLKRDSFDASELAIFSALIRWAETECKRQQLPLTCHSKRLVLHDLLYVVRFFQMPFHEFTSGPGESKLLSPKEVDFIKNVLLHSDRPHYSTVTASSGETKRNLNSSTGSAFNKHQIQTCAELQALRAHWKYQSRPRTPRLNNGNIGKSDSSNTANNGKKRRKYSLEGAPKKGLMKFKRIGLLVKNFVIRKSSTGHQSNGQEQQLAVLINNDLHSNYGSSGPSKKRKSKSSHHQGNARHDTLQRRKSKLSKAFEVSVSTFAFFFD